MNADLVVPEEMLLGAGGVVSMAQYIETYRRGEVPPPPPPEPAPSEEPLPDIPEPTVPAAQERASSATSLPAAVVFGFGGLILFILLGGTYQVVRVYRDGKEGTGSGNDSSGGAEAVDPGSDNPVSAEVPGGGSATLDKR